MRVGLAWECGYPPQRSAVCSGRQATAALASWAGWVLVVFGVLAAGPASGAALDAEAEARSALEEARLALAQGHADQAEILLERVLMLMPDHAEARIDFALLIARRGQLEVAQALISSLADDPRTPDAHRRRLRALLASLRAPAGPGEPAARLQASSGSGNDVTNTPLHEGGLLSRWRLEGQWAYSSNPLARTSAEGITLSLADGPVTLPVTSRPEPGNVVGVSVQRLQADSGVDLALQHLDSPGAKSAYRMTWWGSATSLGLTGRPAAWALSSQRGFDGQRRLTGALLVEATMSPLAAPAKLTLAIYRDPDLSDKGLFVRAEQPWVGFPSGLSTMLAAELSRSLAKSQAYVRITAGADLPLGKAGRLQAQLNWQQDLHGYSPLLENNARRQLATASVVYEQSLRSVTGKPVTLRLFSSRRHGNLGLFSYRDTGAQLVWAQRW